MFDFVIFEILKIGENEIPINCVNLFLFRCTPIRHTKHCATNFWNVLFIWALIRGSFSNLKLANEMNETSYGRRSRCLTFHLGKVFWQYVHRCVYCNRHRTVVCQSEHLEQSIPAKKSHKFIRFDCVQYELRRFNNLLRPKTLVRHVRQNCFPFRLWIRFQLRTGTQDWIDRRENDRPSSSHRAWPILLPAIRCSRRCETHSMAIDFLALWQSDFHRAISVT